MSAQAAPIWRQVRAGAAQSIAEARQAKGIAMSLGAQTWAEIALPIRTALVMLATDSSATPGNPSTLARQPWDAFSEADRVAIAATALMFKRETKHAESLAV